MLKFCLINLFILSLSLTESAIALTSKWGENDHSKVRIRVIGVDPACLPNENNKKEKNECKLEALIEMSLEDGWYTYYKEPGDLGVPTTIKSLSNNEFELYWPKYDTIKHVIGDKTLFSNVYYRSMILPMKFSLPIDKINLEINYAVCNNICIPLKMVMEFDLPKKIEFDEDNKVFLVEQEKLIPEK